MCSECNNTIFSTFVDDEEDAIKVKCNRCGKEKILLDCDDVWEESRPKSVKCPVCKRGKEFNLKVGLIRRDNGSVKWVYIGNRCVNCGVLGFFLDWKIDYEPTDEMENNI